MSAVAARSPRQAILDFIHRAPHTRLLVSPLDSGNWGKRVHHLPALLPQDDSRLIEAQLRTAELCGYPPVLKFETGNLDLLVPERRTMEKTGDREVTRYWYSTPRGEVAWTTTSLPTSVHSQHDPLDPQEKMERTTWVCENLTDFAGARRKIRAIIDQIGERGLFCLNVGHPFFALADIDDLIYLHFDNPDLIRGHIRRMTNHRKRLIAAAAEEGVNCFFLSGISRNLLSPDMIRDWIVPHAAELRQCCHEHGAIVYLHDCGRMRRNFDLGFYREIAPDWLEGCDAPPVGDIDDIGALRKSLPETLVLKGNLNIEFLAKANPEEVADRTRHLLEGIGSSRHIVGGACSLLADTPVENIRAMVNAVEQFQEQESRS